MIPKSTHPNRVRENLAAAGVVLTRAELDAILPRDSGTRIAADPAEGAFTEM